MLGYSVLSTHSGSASATIPFNFNGGSSLAGLGHLRGVPGRITVAVGADRHGAYIPGIDGAIYLIEVDSGGEPQKQDVLAQGMLGFDGLADAVDDNPNFGASSAALPASLDANRTDECGPDCAALMVVGAPDYLTSQESGDRRGAVFLISLSREPRVLRWQLFTPSAGVAGSIAGVLGWPAGANADAFGLSVAWVGDLDGDGLSDFAVGMEMETEDGGGASVDAGAVAVLRRNPGCGVHIHGGDGANRTCHAGLAGAAVLNGSMIPGASST